MSEYSKGSERIYLISALLGSILFFYGLFLVWKPLGLIALGAALARVSHDLFKEEKAKK